ncbi:DUF2309 family protein [Roseobacter sp. HKCCD9010]|uniref:YbcC family protein n=2 Tax=unclassified Roseobacter TaxID=196798 RepID=UPI00149209FD|nr:MULTISPECIES: DUF2309 domain-containing protein [unclassified Roseobacter]MBF9049277.1 DUF2309 family protein [Rhodobacterales bacterium HKCCD4356]NNW91049.1 DUF2309 family protein [Roseobacter sp. HKCCD9063]NNZ89821.1 DUF2309 family protein [Roseobacter sp. HKCCD7632]NNZ93422.1 DUF2309 family protein [Roseobacter sp. HKCCD5934-2]NOB33842.1 DUF2309 family protein [Roseobacter sp. HKCCD8421]
MTLMTDITADLTPQAIATAADSAGRRLAPIWPLSSFVAVNPFLGLADRPFDEAVAYVGKIAGAQMTLPRKEYANAITTGRITGADLDYAVAQMPDVAVDGLALGRLADEAGPEGKTPWKTVADLAVEATGRDWPAHVTERIASFAAAHFDAGQAAWKLAGAGGLWAAWKAEAAHDASAEILGVTGARAKITALPDDAEAALLWAAGELGLSEAVLAEVFTRALYTISGWAGHARYHLWQAELAGETDNSLRDLLTVRMVWEALLLPHVDRAAWEQVKAAYADLPKAGFEDRAALALQIAYEHGWQREVFAELGQETPAAPERPNVQAAFCIDVRSEVFRRALETTLPGVETIGFAGFFGAALSYRPLGAAHSTARCPVLLSPAGEASDETNAELAATRQGRIAAKSLWTRFKQAAVASFGYVEALGLSYAPKLLAQSLRGTTALGQGNAGLTDAEAATLTPSLDVIPPADRAATAATILGAMSMAKGPFARIVMLAGHGGQSLNNPHAAGLDCGACGGHTGEANARLVAKLLNDPQVRAELPDHGINLPSDTVFIAALHDTTTDQVALFDIDNVVESHADDLAQLQKALKEAGGLARAERASLLSLDKGLDLDGAIAARARDWSQVRPEWALAGCAAFIAAPRHRTQGTDLAGRSFLHSYEWQADAENGFGVLELILTAPLVVASWINLQYYGSSVDNKVFGAGNKVLHNVSGLVGVLEGTGGDLRPGLPLQSVHDGERLIHEPMRLSAVVEAPVDAMNAVIEKHEGLRDLLDNGWLHLFQMDASGQVALRYTGDLTWEPVAGLPMDRAVA